MRVDLSSSYLVSSSVQRIVCSTGSPTLAPHHESGSSTSLKRLMIHSLLSRGRGNKSWMWWTMKQCPEDRQSNTLIYHGVMEKVDWRIYRMALHSGISSIHDLPQTGTSGDFGMLFNGWRRLGWKVLLFSYSMSLFTSSFWINTD